MNHLIDTKAEDLKYGAVFYRVNYQGIYLGPYLCLGFRINQATRRLPYSAIICSPVYRGQVNAVVSMVLATKQQYLHHTNSNFLVDPTAAILIEGIALE